MGHKLIKDVVVTSLKQIHDDRGAVFHVLKKSENQLDSFGEVYFSKINFNIVKGWKCY